MTLADQVTDVRAFVERIRAVSSHPVIYAELQATVGPRHTGQVEPEPGSLAEYFDGWYADMTGSPVKDEIRQRHLGLPPHLLSTSLLGWDGIAEAAAGLRLFPGGTLMDLACGRGGYDQRLPGRLRRVDLGAGLTAAGFEAVEVRDRPGWRASERAMWQEAAVLDPGDDPALRSFHDEGVRSLEIFGLVRRVIATASAP